MSRYTVPHATHEIAVGYDGPLQSYFAQVIAPKQDPDDDYEDDVFLVQIGQRPKEVTCIVRFKQMFEGQSFEAGVTVELSKELEAMLFHDHLAAAPPTELQKRGLAMAAEFEKQHKAGK